MSSIHTTRSLWSSRRRTATRVTWPSFEMGRRTIRSFIVGPPPTVWKTNSKRLIQFLSFLDLSTVYLVIHLSLSFSFSLVFYRVSTCPSRLDTHQYSTDGRTCSPILIHGQSEPRRRNVFTTLSRSKWWITFEKTGPVILFTRWPLIGSSSFLNLFHLFFFACSAWLGRLSRMQLIGQPVDHQSFWYTI